MSSDPTVTDATRRAILDLMADGRPRSLPQISAALQDHADLSGDEGLERIYQVVEAAPGFMTLNGEEVFDLHAVLSGRVFAHRLSADERATGVVTVRPDIVPVALAAQTGSGDEEDDSIRLKVAGAGEVPMVFEVADPDVGPEFREEVSRGGGISLGVPALDAIRSDGDVVAARFQDGELHLTAADAAEPDPDAVAALKRHFDEIRGEDEGPIGMTPLLVTWLIDDADALRRPGAPFAAMLEAAGLSRRDAYVGPGDTDWLTPPEIHAADVRRRNTDVYGFDDCCHTAYEEVTAAFGEESDVDAGTVGRNLAHGEVAAAFLAEEIAAAGHHVDDVAKELVDFTSSLLEVADADSAPAVLYVRATAHECLGSVANAEQDLRLALRLDSGHRRSLITAAGYLDDRGDARRALDNLRRAGLEDDHPQVVRLQRIVDAEPPKVGRNEPCPCGSGRKFKACCIDRSILPVAVQAEWLYAKILGFTLHPARRGVVEHLAIHAIEREGGDEDPEDRIDDDIRIAEIAAFEADVIRWFAEERAALLPRHELDLVEDWSEQPLGVFEVRSVDGDDVVLTDLGSGNDVDVSTFTFDEIRPGTTIAGRLLPVGPRAFLGGPVCEVPEDEVASAVALAAADDASAHDWADWLGHIDAVGAGAATGPFERSEGHHHAHH